MVRAFHNVRWLAVVGVCFAAVSPLGAQGLPGRGRPIEFSEPRSSVNATNLSEANADGTSLRKFDDQFKKPFELFGFGQTPGARLASPPPPARVLPAPPASRSLRELLQKRDQWLELEMEEGEGLGLTPQEMLRMPRYGRDGEPVKRPTQIERYYEDLDRARAAAQVAVTNRASRDMLNSRFFGEEEEIQPLNLKLFEEPASPFASESGDSTKPGKLKSGLPGFADLSAPRNQPRDFSEIFGLGTGPTGFSTAPDAGGYENRRRTVEDLLTLRFVNNPVTGPNNAPGLGGAPAPLMRNPLTGSASPSAATTPGLASGPGLGAAASGAAGFNPAAPLANSVSSLATPPALLGAPQPAWGTPPPPEAPRPKLAPAPFQIPQRKF
jgi:hypothetical protein